MRSRARGLTLAAALPMTHASSHDRHDVLAILTRQHTEVDELVELLAREDVDRQDLFDDLADKLAAHIAAEETVFYPAIFDETTDEELREAVEEHLAMKRLIADMLALDPTGDRPEFDAKLKVLKEQLTHHAHVEEEGKLFPQVRDKLTAVRLVDLGLEVERFYEAMMGGDPRFEIPTETAEAAPLPRA